MRSLWHTAACIAGRARHISGKDARAAMIMKRQPGAGFDYAVLIINIPHALTADNFQIQMTAGSLITLFLGSFP